MWKRSTKWTFKKTLWEFYDNYEWDKIIFETFYSRARRHKEAPLEDLIKKNSEILGYRVDADKVKEYKKFYNSYEWDKCEWRQFYWRMERWTMPMEEAIKNKINQKYVSNSNFKPQ